jgi:SAM-dependent methyltransferase
VSSDRQRRLLARGRHRAGKLLAILRHDGFVESLVLVGGYIEYRLEKRFGASVDRKYGSETGGRVPLDRLEIESPNLDEGVQYEPVSEFYLRRMLAAVPIAADTYAFIDLGSGKGRPLLIAAEYPFRRLIGIEFSQELHRIAQQNVARFSARTGSAQRFELHLGDVTSFDFPPEPLALHLYNPFGERVLRHVLDRLQASLQELPRNVLIFYRTPVHRRLLDEAPFLRPIKVTTQYAVYASLAATHQPTTRPHSPALA